MHDTINVGTGKPITIKGLAETLIRLYRMKNLQPLISSEYRKGDIRHCYADTQKAQRLLNFKPSVKPADGLIELSQWAKSHRWETQELFDKSFKELKERQLVF
jgi:dTDP-L-rhamnose 4-epimerase